MRSLWTDPAAWTFPVLDRDRCADVLVVGGGLTGLGAAWSAASAGASTVLVEGRSIVGGASGRNAGFVLAGPSMLLGCAVQTLGESGALDIWRLTCENHRSLNQLIEALEIDCSYLRRGSLSLAASAEEWRDLRSEYDLLCRLGISAALVEREALPQPFDRIYLGGLYYPGNAELDPAAFVRGVAARLPGGARLFEGTSVDALHFDGGWVAETRRGTISADAVVLATNAWTPRLLPSLPIQPIRGQVLSTAPLPRVTVPFPMHADCGYRYWRQTPEGRLVVGGWRNLDLAAEETADEALNTRIQAELAKFLALVAGSAAEIEHRWAGIMGFTPDSFPIVGAMPDTPRLLVAAGYSGHGVAMAFECGARVARLALGGEAHLPEAFRPERFL